MSKNPAARKQTTPTSLHSQKDVNESATGNNLSNHAKVIAFVDDPNTLKRAAEGSMEKRQALLDRVADNNLDEIVHVLAAIFYPKGMKIGHTQLDRLRKAATHIDSHYIKKSDVVDIVMSAMPDYMPVQARTEIEQALTAALKGKI